MKALAFWDWSGAFDHCREHDKPIIAVVEDEAAKIFPSGHSKTLRKDSAVFDAWLIAAPGDRGAPRCNEVTL